MINATIRIDGIDVALSILRSLPEMFESGVEQSAQTLRKLTIGRTPYRTGTLKRSWGQVERNQGGFSFTNPQFYARTLEEGLYETVGPRTVAMEGGIFSRQAPGGILTPLVEDETVLRRIAELIVREIERGVASAGA